MKNIIVLFSILGSTVSYAGPKKPEKSLEIKAHVVKMMISGDKLYRLELREFAAVYHAKENFAPCLQKAIKENKEVTLKVSSQSLNVQECKVN